MKFYPAITFFLLIIGKHKNADAQLVHYFEPINNKGQFYVYWGWNRDAYTTSDIHFKGNNYDFTLDNVVAKDRQSDFDVKLYCNPLKATIPQYNFRMGYFITDKLSITLGIDHMKYVVQQRQTAIINGTINATGTQYDGNYVNHNIVIRPGFLEFEHTDGLNYLNAEIRRTDNLITIGHIQLNAFTGAGAGMLIPKTNCTLLNYERNDEFHISGFGVDGLIALQTVIYRYFFLQTELKGGFINLPDVRTTSSLTDGAQQQMFFAQWNVVFGVNFNLNM